MSDEDNRVADPFECTFYGGDIACKCVEAVLGGDDRVPIGLKRGNHLVEGRAVGPDPVTEHNAWFDFCGFRFHLSFPCFHEFVLRQTGQRQSCPPHRTLVAACCLLQDFADLIVIVFFLENAGASMTREFGGKRWPSTLHKAGFPSWTVRGIPDKPLGRVHISPFPRYDGAAIGLPLVEGAH